jgi:copper chaperone CopZ
MKNYFLSIAFIALIIPFATAQDQQKGELTLTSSIVCEMCKNTIEEGLAYTEGVKTARVDVENNEIYVKYKPKKITEKEVKEAINELGYVAGDMKPSKKQYATLHGCCKMDGVCE